MQFDDIKLAAPDATVLREAANPLQGFGTPETESWNSKMGDALLRVCAQHGGIGIAAPQCGIPWRVIAISMPRHQEVMFNPVITWRSGLERHIEGCLSCPGVEIPVWRSQKVKVEYLDAAGNKKTRVCSGMLARVVQHEIDHLDGILITDERSGVRRRALS